MRKHQRDLGANPFSSIARGSPPWRTLAERQELTLGEEEQKVIFRGLQAADQAGYRKVSLPTIRMGVMLGMVERSAEEAARETAAGMQMFLDSSPKNVRELFFVVYNDATTKRALQSLIADMLPAPDGQ